jgi:hypothetical protein
MQSETSAHVREWGKCFCCKCTARGTAKEKESDKGFDSLFYPGIPQTKEAIMANVEEQIRAACLGVVIGF